MHSMTTAVLIATTVFGMVFDAKCGETNVVFKKTLVDGREVEVWEAVVFRAGATASNKHQSVAESSVYGPPLGGGTISYRMVLKSGEPQNIEIWRMDSDFIAENVKDSRCSFLDVASKGNKIAILYTRNVGMFVAVVDLDAKSESRSHHLMNSMSPTAVSAGQLAWLDDDIYVLFRTGNTRRAIFLVGADGKCTRMKLDADMDKRGTID